MSRTKTEPSYRDLQENLTACGKEIEVLHAELEDLRAKTICGMVCTCGPNLEPLACGYKVGHGGEHSWATLPTFVAASP